MKNYIPGLALKEIHNRFDTIAEIIDLMYIEMAEKNPTFLIKDYDKLVSYKDIIDKKRDIEVYEIRV